ncbi:hypothetical protein HY498_04410 [Candidatus Woesearchaeota archaeon]|nr:hypothetical protein [Candidatus Woesearchaeota archaeon]
MAITDAAGMMAFFGAFFLFFSILILGVYIYVAIALMSIAKKTNTENGWLAFIPIANIYLMTQIAGISGWYTLLLLLSLVPFIGSLAMLIFIVFLWWKIAEAVHRPGWWGILMLIPVVNLIIIGIMAWGK